MTEMAESKMCDGLAAVTLGETTTNGSATTNTTVHEKQPDKTTQGQPKSINKHNGHSNAAYDKSVPAELKKKIAQTKKLKNGDQDCPKEEKKLVELLIHVFDALETPELKLEALARKYVLLASDHRAIEIKLDDVTNKYNTVVKSKDFLQLENSKISSAKTKLESLCRELQKQNKAIKSDADRRASEEDQKRKELSEKFQVTINEISTQVSDNHQTNQQLRLDNNELTQKLKGLLDQYELREQHIEKVLKTKELELQLCETKLQQQILQTRQDKEEGLLEKQVLLQDAIEQKKCCELLMKQEAELKGQLGFYMGKFEEFQSTLTKSNDMFGIFQKEKTKMTKAIKKLEKESLSWKTRHENTNRSLLQMVDERITKDQEVAAVKNKVDKLENLCRILQSERNDLRKQLQPQQPTAQTTASPPQEANADNEEDEKKDDKLSDQVQTTASLPQETDADNEEDEKNDDKPSDEAQTTASPPQETDADNVEDKKKDDKLSDQVQTTVSPTQETDADNVKDEKKDDKLSDQVDE